MTMAKIESEIVYIMGLESQLGIANVKNFFKLLISHFFAPSRISMNIKNSYIAPLSPPIHFFPLLHPG